MEKKSIDMKKVMSCIEDLYRCGEQPDGTHTRMAYSQEDVKGREVFQNYFEELGLKSRMDDAGNIFIRMKGKNDNLPAILVGSHLDTVPDGGKYDGVLGCVAGLAICDAVIRSGEQLEHSLEVVVFTDEEGFRFGSGLLGSSAICGEDPEIKEDDIDLYGQRRSEVMRAYGISPGNIRKAKKDKESVHCFFELHIEQGGILDKKKIPIGLVTSIAGVSRYEIVISGEANHAGSTVMGDRRDALVGASKLIAVIPEIVEQYGNAYSVATVGTMKVSPNSVNVIPGEVTFNLEIRDQDIGVIQLLEDKIKAYLERVCADNQLICSFQKISAHDAAPMSEWVKKAIKKAIDKQKYDYIEIPSGAFHDSLIMTAKFPTGMIFIPSINGISHSRYELSREEDIQKGCEVLFQAVLEVDQIKKQEERAR